MKKLIERILNVAIALAALCVILTVAELSFAQGKDGVVDTVTAAVVIIMIGVIALSIAEFFPRRAALTGQRARTAGTRVQKRTSRCELRSRRRKQTRSDRG